MFFGKPESFEWYAKRCALYVRVSTEEQVRHGYSLEAQLEELREYADQFCMQVVGVYIDDGVSARKAVSRRKGLTDLLESVQREEIDYVLFIKLDRWFRSVQEYYKVQEILEAHNVGWKAILEDYDTTTTNGRLNLNIRLSVAQDESDRTSDRIKFVNDNRIKHGGAITGSYPLGLYSENGKVKVDEKQAQVVKALFDYYEETGSVRQCIDYISDNFGLPLGYNRIKKMLLNPLYTGEYRGNDSYCPAIIQPEQFQRVQVDMKRKATTREQRHFFIFRGLIVCPECGRRMGGWAQHDYKFGRIYLRYRCNQKWIDKACSHKFTPWEQRIEKYLKTNIKSEVESYLNSFSYSAKRQIKPKTDLDKIRKKLDRLKHLYIEELIDLDEYRKDYHKLNEQLAQAERERQNVKVIQHAAALNRIKEMDFENDYEGLSALQKHRLWASVIDKIIAIDKDTFKVVFL